MAGMVSWEQLRELAGFRAAQGCAVSVYLDLDPSQVPTAPDVEVRVNSLIRRAERLVEERKGGLSREAREALKSDLQRIGTWFDDGFDRQGAQGVAVFTAGLDNFWSTLTTSDRVPDDVRIASELYLAPLARLLGRGEATLVAAVGRERGDVYRLQDGVLVEIADETEAGRRRATSVTSTRSSSGTGAALPTPSIRAFAACRAGVWF